VHKSPAPDLARVTVVMATFHSSHCVAELGACLAGFPQVVVVDNASTDDTVVQLKQHLPQATVLVNQQNMGFGAANNRAIAAAQTEFVLLLNPDCVITAEAVESLVDAIGRYPRVAAVGPQLLDRKGQLDLSYCMRAGGWPTKGPAAEGDLSVGFLSGACMLIRRDAMQQIGGFDEDFFLYQEDADLCLRLKAQCGELILAPDARVVHYSRGSSGGKGRNKAEYLRGYHHIQSKFLFDAKHDGGRITARRRRLYVLTAALELLLRALLMDTARASRAFGRMHGACRYVTPQSCNRH
jgi:N-acetylglucosaminyl-diphospho-decaprenol L-rhamnosyltransferase